VRLKYPDGFVGPRNDWVVAKPWIVIVAAQERKSGTFKENAIVRIF